MTNDWSPLFQSLLQHTGQDYNGCTPRSLGGGSINSAWLLDRGGNKLFVKTNDSSRLDMFAAEAEGLQEMADSNTLYIPAPLSVGIAGNRSYLAMEYLQLGGGNKDSMQRFGRGLADMHRHSSDSHGWHRQNTIGSTPQINTRDSDWVAFFQKNRLGFQLQLATQNGADRHTLDRGQQLMENLGGFFSDYQPRPSLLHGDLWSGNYAILASGEATIFDPAVHYGDRECDLAMSELFGGFPASFYNAYNEHWPLDQGYHTRKTLYKLYHILNHFNLFGGGYLGQSAHMIDSLLAELRGD